MVSDSRKHELKVNETTLAIKLGDITEEDCDAIVNAANSSLMGGGGVDGAIHQKGGPRILEECIKIRKGSLPNGLPAGEAVITTGGDLKAKKVIHTVGPTWQGGGAGEEELLRAAYHNSLVLAKKNGLRTVSFPSISTGAFGYPVNLAAPVAINAIVAFIREEDYLKSVTVVIFNERDLQEYINVAKAIAKA